VTGTHARRRRHEHARLTPHLGSATRTTRQAMGMLAVQGLAAVLLDDVRPAHAVV